VESVNILNFDELKKAEDALKHLSDLGDECSRIAIEIVSPGEILGEIDEEFSKATGIINKKDLTFLSVATGLLCAKWLIMGQVAPLDFDFKHDPKARKRLEDHKDGDKLAEKEKKKELKEWLKEAEKEGGSKNGYRTIEQIVFGSVPYDATSELPDKEAFAFNPNPDGMGAQTKHVFTMGHDPVLGWLFGPINIMTFSSTLKKGMFETYKVNEESFKYSSVSTFPAEMKIAFDSFREDNKRLPAAVFKQGLHLLSDKYCKIGLPIPFLSPETAWKLIQKGWNSVEAAAAIKKVLAKTAKNAAIIGAQFVISFLINEIIKAVHLMMYDEDKDGDIKLYQVRTRKILLTANCISSSSNVLFCAIFGAATKNPIAAAKRLDIGGFIETIHRLVVDTKFIKEIKREYIRENLERRILNTTGFDWWYVDEEGGIKYE
jgi:hypothetical protein